MSMRVLRRFYFWTKVGFLAVCVLYLAAALATGFLAPGARAQISRDAPPAAGPGTSVRLPDNAVGSVRPPGEAAGSVRPPPGATVEGAPAPGVERDRVRSGVRQRIMDTADSAADYWRAVRQGVQGTVSIPNKKAGVLIQSEGENWRNIRNGPLADWGAWIMLGMLVILALFFLIRGRIRIERGRSGAVITRFTFIERFAHWLVAVPFILLALTGLNMLYGRWVLLPMIGPDAFSALTIGGKVIHNYVAFAFMAGLVLIFLLWVPRNLPRRHDFVWLAKGGGMFTRGSHPPAGKFNAGQKLLFWVVILGGISISLSGIALLWPFEFAFFSETFAAINWFGADLPTDLHGVQEMQLSQLWHAAVGLVLIAIIIAHIYIGTIGMEGAFDAMGNGRVDRNWAREHHPLWVDEVEERAPVGGDD